MSTKTCCWKQNKIKLSFKIKFLKLFLVCKMVINMVGCGYLNGTLKIKEEYIFLMIFEVFIYKQNFNLKGDVNIMKFLLKVRFYCVLILRYFVKNYLQQDMPEQYLCGKRNQDIAYTGSYFFERYSEKEEK